MIKIRKSEYTNFEVTVRVKCGVTLKTMLNMFFLPILLLLINNPVLAKTNDRSQDDTKYSSQQNQEQPSLNNNDITITRDQENINNKFSNNFDASRNYFNQALSLAKSGNHKAAVSLLDLAIRLDPKYVDAYIARASMAEKTGNLKSALVDYSHALNIRQSDKIFYERGAIELALKAFSEAIRDFTAAIEINPQFARAYNERGVAFLANNMLEEAKNDFTRAYELNDKILTALEKIGEINMFQSQFEQALENFNKLISLKPDYPKAYFNRGKVYEYLKMHEKALQDYSKGVELNKGLHTDTEDSEANDKQVNSHSI